MLESNRNANHINLSKFQAMAVDFSRTEWLYEPQDNMTPEYLTQKKDVYHSIFKAFLKQLSYMFCVIT